MTLRTSFLAGVSLAVTVAASGGAQAGSFFERVSTFPVYKTLAEGVDMKTETSAEIISASKDGNTLVFSDSPSGAIVFVDATDPAALAPKGRVDVSGEPTSVSVGQAFAYAGVNTSETYVTPSGHLAVIALADMGIAAKCDVKGQPDSVATSADGKYVVIAIENERDEELNDGVIPQMPAGHLAIFDLDANGMPTNCDAVRIVDMTGLSEIAPTDPEPEFVSINDKNQAVVTLQENNHIVVVDLASGEIVSHFPAGAVTVENIPVKKTRVSDANGSIENVKREPDAVAWLDADRFVTANEGDYEGGSRGFTIWNTKGEVLFDSGAQIEHLGMETGHYPAKRAAKKGTEPEGVTVGAFDGQTYIFINSERGNFVAVYKDTGAEPEFVQILPTHIAPEGSVTIPSRGLFVVANEADSAEDGFRAQVSVYKFGAEEAAYPMVVSDKDPETGAPIGWGALSGLAADPSDAAKVYAVTDSFYDTAKILTLDVSAKPARITGFVALHGKDTPKYDLEGISVARDGGFWLASEGNPDKEMKHLLIKAAVDGTVEDEIELPVELVAQSARFSLEGVAEFQRDGQTLVALAVQREWKDDPKGMVKLAIYNPADKSWGFVHYPLDKPASPAGGWVGLSEIVSLGDEEFLILERDNQGGEFATIKEINRISLKGVAFASYGSELPVVEKVKVKDILPELQASHGWVLDKPEGLTVTASGEVILVTDNDGVDDAPGATELFHLGQVSDLK